MARVGVTRPALVFALLASALAGAVLGASWMHHGGRAQDGPAPFPAGSGIPGSAAPALSPLPVDGPSGFPEPASRLQLMQRYAGELDEDTRGALLAELQRLPDDDTRRFALDLVSSADPDTRLRGYALLASFPLDHAEVRGAVLAGLAAERDPLVIARVVDLAVPTVLPASEAAPMADALQALATHADAGVRARSLVQAAQWAEPGGAEPLLAQAFLDESPEVRHAAVAGVIATRAQSPQIKDALLWIAGDPETSAEQRSAAVFALQWYRLEADEYALYRQAEAASGGHDH